MLVYLLFVMCRLSLKGAQEMQGEGEEADFLTAVRGNPNAPLLREMLRAKKDLLTKMNRMYNSFLGDTQQLYSDEVRRTPSVAESLTTPRRLSLPSPVSTSAQSLQQDFRRASMGAFFTTSSTPNSPPRIRTCLLKDYLLVPGAKWSHLKQGDEVVLTGRLESGWFRCLAHTDVGATEEGMDIFPGYIHISDDNCDSLPDTPSPQLDSADTPSPNPGACEGVTDMFISDPENTDKDTCNLPSCDQASESRDTDTRQSHDQSVVLQGESPRSMRVGRSYSYIAATQTNPESSLLGLQNARRSLDYGVIHKRKEERHAQGGVERQDSVGALEDLLSQLAKSNTRSFRFPLVGVVPPSVVKNVPEMSDLILVTPPIFSQSLSQSVGVVASSDHSPAHSFSMTESTYQSAHQQAICSSAMPPHSVQPDTHTQSPLQTKMQEPSNSAPTTPLHTAVLSPVPTPSSTTPGNVEMSPNKLPISPLKSPRARRHVYEPVAAMLDNPFIKKFLPGKKPSKQKSLPDKLSISKTPTIEEEAPYSLSPSPAPPSPPHSPLPPPAMLEFSEQAMQADMRTRMSSFSGRPIKSTGICLQFGEDDSSSDSDRDSITESDVPERLALSQSLSSTGGFAGGSIDYSPTEISGLLLPPSVSPDILAPGNLRRAASAHGSLYVRVENGEPAIISPDSRNKSCSTHSLTSPIVRGLYNSFNESPVPAKKRNSSKKRQGSEREETEPESPKFGGIFRQPPTGQRRFVYLDPRQPKYGFRLEVWVICRSLIVSEVSKQDNNIQDSTFIK
ncbi:hypothetical protein GBAR_LOCUS11259 [Geodia barretti]|uniref:SH3 domain-containing protein n=1 Tax=Geodia barretti TaxID=519541 RepID=A0AA35RY44_GEOBA|nr:hypothetical protein GBAR_LOCUS11259 [Geodia barretti]